jgi:class 3 adenylate cyclase
MRSRELVPHIARLLGDPARDRTMTVQGWLADAWESLSSNTGHDQADRSYRLFDLACAQLHDSRLEAALSTFLRLVESHGPLHILAAIGHARALNGLRRYAGAEFVFRNAVTLATEADEPLLATLARNLLALNLSDWHDSDTDSPQADPEEFDGIEDPDLALLLDAHRTVILGKLRLRNARRGEGRALVEAMVIRPDFDRLAPIPRGMVVRLRGIFRAVFGNDSAARAELAQAIHIFQETGYQLGEVQAALSLAWVTARVERRLTEQYLDRAWRILDETDAAEVATSGGRQMPAERAMYYGRRAEVKLANGEIKAALEDAQQDLKLVERADLPRPCAYAHRNIGRICLAAGNFALARKHLSESGHLFQGVGDRMNVFFSRVLEVEAMLACREYDSAKETIAELESLVATASDRPKELAVAKTLRAVHGLRVNPQSKHLNALRLASEAVSTLRDYQDRDFVRALLAEAECYAAIRDTQAAKRQLIEAWHCVDEHDLEDQRRGLQAAFERFDMPLPEAPRRDDLRTKCEKKGLVATELVTMFADIRGFTEASARTETGQMAMFINDFAKMVGKCIRRYGGDPVRFLGDGVMALFRPSPRHPSKAPEVLALCAACDIHGMFKNLCDAMASSMPSLGSIGLGFGVGTGNVVAGIFGTDTLSEFSVIGASVNLAARIQGVAGDGEVAMCETTAERALLSFPKLGMVERSYALKGLGEVKVASVPVASLLPFMSHRPPARSIPPEPPEPQRHVPRQSEIRSTGPGRRSGGG